MIDRLRRLVPGFVASARGARACTSSGFADQSALVRLSGLGAAFATLLIVTMPQPATAQAAYPDKAIRLVIPYTPGGPADLLGRFVANKLATPLGQAVVIDNKPGAGLTIGANLVAKSPPDGYTFLLAASSMLIASGQGSRAPEDNLRDFAPVSLVGSFPLVLVTAPELPVASSRELAAYIAARPGAVNYGTSGNGSLTHLAAALFNQMAGLNSVHVPYRGINEALNDLTAGRVQYVFAGAPIALPRAAGGKIKAIGVTSLERTSSAPELPSVAEGGLKGYEVTPWYGFVAPAGTPEAIIARVHREIVQIMRSDEVRERWKTWGADPTFSQSPAQFAQLMRAEADKWARLIASGVKMD
jgi:tripartite-type tricarboxylate transporter receptor subunit TctC